ncbi:MAG: hypothetical protein EON95_03175 [Caulobacteraceae bacterium]|nr:MAG: hypothetical protein EON95_03175 [Caulobacteraceae bacterium]
MKQLLLIAALSLAASAPALAQDAPEGGAWTDCTVSEIAAYRDRVEIVCAGPAAKGMAGDKAGPRRFAVETRDPVTDSLLKLAIEAKGRSRPLGVLYVVAPEANPADCPAATCRRVAGATLK